ncbi:hypothetical protein QBC39DRAFT_330123 [Podospora conica]|nr:hypothetical protein QBC39DRAFT_330123 [Schizothecium conicum]
MLPMLPNTNRKPAFTPQTNSFHQLSTSQNTTAPATSTTIPYLTDFDLSSFNLEEFHRSFTSSPSPSLTYSGFSEHSPIERSLSTFDQNPTSASPRASHPLFADSPLFPTSDNMQDWYIPNNNTHLTPRSVGRPHQRESSLSSLGSNGPASPHPSNTVNPYIAQTDSGVDGLHAMHNTDDFNNHFQLAKSYEPSGQNVMLYPMYQPADSVAMYPRSAAPPKRKSNHGQQRLIGQGPVSGASSINSESPATPAEEPEVARRSQNSEDSAPFEILSSSPSLPMFRDTVLPKLERTESDIMNAELCSPIFTITSSNTSQPQQSRSNTAFDRSLQQAFNNNHLTASPVGTTSRAPSPFQNSSPLAQTFSNYGATQDTRSQQQMGNTISPKDAMLEYSHAGDATNFSLFPSTNSQGFGMDAMSKAMPQNLNGNMGFGSFVPELQITAPYNHFHGLPHSGVPSLSTSLAPTRLGSAETGIDLSPSSSPQRPGRTGADGGTYSCTYHGCPRRFETPQLLQKHKKEGHRGGGTKRAESVAPGMTSALLDSQNGPHRCERTNPSTGNPCNKVFSRPYDLTRHESTVHDPNKQKVLCDLCVEEKAFSRGDALTRHYRVCHPDHEVPAKYRKRQDPHR